MASYGARVAYCGGCIGVQRVVRGRSTCKTRVEVLSKGSKRLCTVIKGLGTVRNEGRKGGTGRT